jgi:hypothetical protein
MRERIVHDADMRRVLGIRRCECTSLRDRNIHEPEEGGIDVARRDRLTLYADGKLVALWRKRRSAGG